MRHAAETSCCQLLPLGSIPVLIFFQLQLIGLSFYTNPFTISTATLPHSRTPLWYSQGPSTADNPTLQRYKATSAELCMTYAGSMHSYLKSPK